MNVAIMIIISSSSTTTIIVSSTITAAAAASPSILTSAITSTTTTATTTTTTTTTTTMTSFILSLSLILIFVFVSVLITSTHYYHDHCCYMIISAISATDHYFYCYFYCHCYGSDCSPDRAGRPKKRRNGSSVQQCTWARIGMPHGPPLLQAFFRELLQVYSGSLGCRNHLALLDMVLAALAWTYTCQQTVRTGQYGPA